MYSDYLKRKERIIITAIDILNESGIQGLTTKEIAKRQGITEAAIYKHFNGKQEIVLTILDRFAAFDEVIINTIKEQNMTPKAGILYFAESFTEYYQSYPQIVTVLFSFDVYKYDELTNLKMSEVLSKRYEAIEDLIKEGQKTGQFDSTIAEKELANIIAGTILSAIFKWKLTDSKENLKDIVTKSINWLLK